MKFSGERCYIDFVSERIKQDHLERYFFASQFSKNKKNLDIACGSGYGTNILSKNAKQVIGIDVNQEAITFAKKSYSHNNISFQLNNIENINFKEEFDVITCFETIEHIKNYEVAIKKLHKSLKRNGILIISSPNRLITSPNAKKITDSPQNPFHSQEFSKNELYNILKNNNFQNISIYGQRSHIKLPNTFIRKILYKLTNPAKNSSPKVKKNNFFYEYRYHILVGYKS